MITTGIVFGLIVLWFLNIPPPPSVPFVEWNEEAFEYYQTNLPEILKKAGVPEYEDNFTIRSDVMLDLHRKAEQIAEQTDSIVHLIDIRIGTAAQVCPRDPLGAPTIFSWEYAWTRLKELEEMTNSTPSWDLTYEAVEYYNIYQSNCTVKVLRTEFGDTPEFKTIMISLKEKLEESAIHTDNVIDLADLRQTIVIKLVSNQKYPTLDAAWARLEELEVQVGCGSD